MKDVVKELFVIISILLVVNSSVVGVFYLIDCQSKTREQYSKAVYEQLYEGSTLDAKHIAEQYTKDYKKSIEAKYLLVLSDYILIGDCEKTVNDAIQLARTYPYEQVHLLAGVKDELDRNCEKTEQFRAEYTTLINLIP